MENIMHSEAAIAIVVFILGLGYKLLQRWDGFKKWKLDTAYLCIQAGVEETYKTYVRDIKAIKEDGKLTSEERSTARETAKQYAIEYAKNNGFNLLKTIGKNLLPLILEKAVMQAKPNIAGVVKNLPSVPEPVWGSGFSQVMPELEKTDSVSMTDNKDGN